MHKELSDVYWKIIHTEIIIDAPAAIIRHSCLYTSEKSSPIHCVNLFIYIFTRAFTLTMALKLACLLLAHIYTASRVECLLAVKN